MIGMVLVSHGHLADEFRSALEHVVGPQRQLQAISIGPEDDMEQRRQDIIDAVRPKMPAANTFTSQAAYSTAND